MTCSARLLSLCAGLLALAFTFAPRPAAADAPVPLTSPGDTSQASPAGVPSPPNSTVPDTLYWAAGHPFTFLVMDEANYPMCYVWAVVDFSARPDFRPCSTAPCEGCVWDSTTHTLGTWTDLLGQATIPLHTDYGGSTFTAPVRVNGEQLKLVTCKGGSNNYVFTLCVNTHGPTGHAFVRLTDGSEVLYFGFHPRYWFIHALDILKGYFLLAAVRDDAGYYAERTSQIQYVITEPKYNLVKQRISETAWAAGSGDIRYQLYSSSSRHGVSYLNCVTFCCMLADQIALGVPPDNYYGRLPSALGVADPVGLDAYICSLLAAGQTTWDGGTLAKGPGCGHLLETASGGPPAAPPRPSGEEVCYGDSLDSVSVLLDCGVQTPAVLAQWFDPPLALDLGTLPEKVVAPGQPVTYDNPASGTGADVVYWNFGDAYDGVMGSPLDSTADGRVTHSFAEDGTYEGTLLVIDDTVLHHYSFTTRVYDGAGIGSPGVGFALYGARPNPAVGSGLTVRFALPGAGDATLELVDVAGRRVVRREVGSLGAGRHEVVLGEAGGVAPGVYLVRLVRGADVRGGRVVVLR
jgi:hypothetical protein